MDDHRQRYPTWQNGLTSSPLMVQGHGARPSGPSHDTESPRKGPDYSGRAVNSHLNRMRSAITGTSQINIQELLKQATEDFEAHRTSSRYRNGIMSNWMYNRDQTDISSALYIRGMDTDSKVMSTNQSERPAVKVIRANIPRADMDDPSANHHPRNHFPNDGQHAQRNANRPIHRRPSTADAVRRIDIPQLNPTTKERKEEPIKLPITAWDTTVNENDDHEDRRSMSPKSDKSKLALSPPNSLDLNSDDEGFLSNAEEDNNKRVTPRSTRDQDEDVLINGPNYDDKTDQLLKYYIQEEHGHVSHHGENSHIRMSQQNHHRPKETRAMDTHYPQSSMNNNHDRRMSINSDSSENQASSAHTLQNQLQSSIIIESPKVIISSSGDFSTIQNHPIRRSRSPRRSNTFLHRRTHHSPWRTYSSTTSQDVGNLAADLRSSFIEITNPLNLQIKNKPPRPASSNNSFIGHSLHSYRPRGKASRSMRVSVSNPDLTSIRVVGTSMSSSSALRNIRDERPKKFPHSSYSVMT